ncbi:class I SAM-dependent methyltransferase [Orenia metallireducens]|nr:class I SAM-dependent methyltransferase [Orenia metallireducens]
MSYRCVMEIKYESVVPWGRTFEEYVDMFNLTEVDLDKSILGCGDGPASFNYTMKEKGKEIISIDPIYQFTNDDIAKRIDETYQDVIEQTEQNKDKFIWTTIKDVEDLGRIRMSAMEKFLADYDLGKQENRYLYAMLPNLPFEDKQFDLALSSHFLFLYTDNLSLEFHIEAIDEMLRVAREVRIFPLLDLNGVRSLYVDEVINKYSEIGYSVNEVIVDYEFQKGGNTMLKMAQKR